MTRACAAHAVPHTPRTAQVLINTTSLINEVMSTEHHNSVQRYALGAQTDDLRVRAQVRSASCRLANGCCGCS